MKTDGYFYFSCTGFCFSGGTQGRYKMEFAGGGGGVDREGRRVGV